MRAFLATRAFDCQHLLLLLLLFDMTYYVLSLVCKFQFLHAQLFGINSIEYIPDTFNSISGNDTFPLNEYPLYIYAYKNFPFLMFIKHIK